MGQNQSQAPSGQDEGEAKLDYYELLSVDRQATDDEIKKAYRKKALELHPDRNYGNVEETTRLFADVQSAYEILSDPQERAWYDSHRDAILRKDGANSGEQYVYNVRLTTADDILRLVTRFNARTEYSDSPNGFFGGLRDTFNNLAREEELACEWEGLEGVDYPSFGHKDDEYDDVVKGFYAVWTGFSTRKTFAWKDQHRYSEAPDRRVRRAMEKENKRLRDEGIREFNDAVRSLVAFVRKRDLRYRPNSQTEAQRQKALRDAAAAQAARARAANEARLTEHTLPEWARSEGAQDELSSEEDIEEEHFECVVCNKTFKSDKQFQTHEKSKKHVKAVKQLQREMKKESKNLDLEGAENAGSGLAAPRVEDAENEADDRGAGSVPGDAEPQAEAFDSGSEGEDEDARSSNGPHAPTRSEEPAMKSVADDPVSGGVSSDDEDDMGGDYAPREDIMNRMTDDKPQTSLDDLASRLASSASLQDRDGSDSTPKKMGKAKQKRAKKAAQSQKPASVDQGTEYKCAACQAGFPSKTRLFTHIKELNHAQPVSQAQKSARAKG